ncbi:TnsD family Tn7-like transposition protein [Pseudomonas veronii]|uniref:TnsD family Tn7-like transposition protein n=1 Tax=Pseudomonas veronii TaxID=76761 RepID=UPI0015A1D4FA|nr:TniQ family protein [Pseudomonas veronii]
MEHRFHFFPEPYPDETLHSVLSRYARLCGFCRADEAVVLPPWKGSFSDNVPFPCQLNELEGALPSGTSLTVARMIERHTLLPYYQPFLSEAQLHQAYFQMEFGFASGLKLSMGLIASRFEHASCTRFCLDCIAHDQAHVGVAYWHRVHQLPGVYLCPHHEAPLMVLEHRTFSQFRRRLMLPDDEVVISGAKLPEIAPRQRPRLLKLAKSSATLLQAKARPLDPFRLRSTLLRAAATFGVVSAGYRLRLTKLASFIENYVDLLPDFGEYHILASFPQGSTHTWLTKLLRKPRHSHHPLRYLVLADALHLDVRDLVIDGHEGPGGLIPSSCSDCRSLPRTTKGCSQSAGFRPQRVNSLTDLGRLIWKDAEKGMSASEIAGKHSVSLATVYRAVRLNPDGPARWSYFRFKRELDHRRGRFVRQYQKRFAHDCSDYMWLYRNDHDWLAERRDLKGERRLARNPSPVFFELDPSLESEIHSCACRLLAMPGKPVWVNRSRIGRELDSTARFEKQLNKLPLCAAALDFVCETRQQFHGRRLAWAEQQLLQNGARVSTSGVYRLASIRMK